MEIIAWVLVVLLALLAAYFGRRSSQDRRNHEAMVKLAKDLEAGRIPEDPSEGDHPTSAAVRQAIREHWVPRGAELEKGRREGRREGRARGQDEALQGMARYVEATVTEPLEESLRTGRDLEGRARAALYALEDLAFFGRNLAEEETESASVGDVVSEVTREFAREYDVPVRFVGPERPLRVALAPEAMKDALYLLLVNAARFGGEDTVEVRLHETDGTCVLEVVDRGDGFTEEALERGAEPFFSSHSDSLGLGLTWAERVAVFHGGSLRARNREEGGAAVEVRLPLTR